MGGNEKRDVMPAADLAAVMTVVRVAPDANGPTDRRLLRLEAMSVLGNPQRCELVVEGPAAVPFADALQVGMTVDVGVRLQVVPGEGARDRAVAQAMRRRLAEHRALDVDRVEAAEAIAQQGVAAAIEIERNLAELASLARARGGGEFRVDGELLGQIAASMHEFRAGIEKLAGLLAGTVRP